jgi:superfamily II DNA helicase RecQ
MLRVAVFTLRADSASGFPDDALRTFCASTDVVAVHDHFFVQDGVPSIALVITHRERVVPHPSLAVHGRPASVLKSGSATAPAVPEAGLSGPEPTEGLSPADLALYETLRRWRNERSRREGRPSYTYLTNRQAADVARLRPTSVGELKSISGIGEARATNFANELLPLIASAALGDPIPVAEGEESPAPSPPPGPDDVT